MRSSHALTALTIASVVILVAGLWGGVAAELVFAAVAVAFPAILMAVGAAGPGGRLGAAVWPIGLLLLVLETCLFGMLALRGQVEGGAWVLGLPAAAAVQVYGVLLVPQLLVALGYALTFDAFGVGDRELRRLRELAPRAEGGAADQPDAG